MEQIEPLYRDEPLLAMMRSKGKIRRGYGKSIDWRPRFRRRTINANAGDIVSLSFPQTATRRKATLPWRSYDLGESVTKFEQYISEGPKEVVLYNIVEKVVEEMMDDFMTDFKAELYVDGNAGNANQIHGLESWFSVSGAYSGGYVGVPNDTYAGLSTALGNYGGSWSATTWPIGTGPTEYHAWSPMVVDYTDTAWDATTKTWPNTWHECLRFATTYMRILQKKGPNLFLLNPELLRQAKNSLTSAETFEITQNPGSALTKLGFQTLQFEGVELMDGYEVPSTVGYGLNFDELSLHHLGPQLVNPDNDEDITTATRRFALMSFCQMVPTTPAYFIKFDDIT
jgi:hypothetical protein